MADESHYSSGYDSATNKRKYEEQIGLPPPPPLTGTRRPTGFSSAPIPSDPTAAPPLSYNSVPPPADEIQIAKQKAQEIAARLLSGADPKRSRVDNGSSFDSGEKGFSSGPPDSKSMSFSGSVPSSTPFAYGGFQGGGSNKKIEIPNTRVGVIIGKGGDTIKYLQLQSGAKIQVTRDMEADPNSSTRMVELMGTPEQIAKAEQLISDVLQEAEAGGSAVVSRRIGGNVGAEQFVMQVPNNKVGLVIGKGGESIKSMQAKSGARIQVIPLHLPPGDTSTERTVQIDGTSEQIELAKQLVNEVISGENRPRNPSMGGYPQQGYQSRPPTSWAPPGAPQMQQPGYGYMQSGGGYPGSTPQYNMPPAPYGGYPPQHTSGGYSSWDQSSAPPSQQTNPGSGYDYYAQQQPSSQQQQPTPGNSSSAPPTDTTGYNYYQQPSGYNQPGQGYSQDGYGGYGAPQQSGYGQPPYDQQQGYGSSAGYGTTNNVTQEGQTQTQSYGAQGDSSSQAPAPMPAQSGQLPSPNPSGYPPLGATPQSGYVAPPPPSQSGYGNQPPQAQSGYGSGHGTSPAQKPPAYGQPGYPPAAGPPPSGYSATAPGQQAGYGPPPPSAQQGYGQAQPPAYSSYGGYAQAPAGYTSDGSAPGVSQTAQQIGATKASPKS